ncbi:MAG: helix-turn-helix domain-containing protein, partial [Bacteroidia bacterium]|nr:helix-turn-helix domain-containing protein [Bacteroidia bacterium]
MSEEELEHYGTPRKSGRYPWGSGENPYQSLDLLGAIYKLQMDHPGMSNAKMAEALGMSTTQLIARKQAAKNEKRAADRAQAMRLKEAGHSNMGIGRIMGINESSVRNLLNPSELQKQDLLNKARDEIKKRVDEARYLDVGIGTEVYMGISKERLNAAVQMLEDAGYNRYVLRTEQLGMPGQYTETKILTKPDVDFKEVIANRDKVAMIAAYSEDG